MCKCEGQILTVGDRLREERKRLGYSQERFAGVAGVAKNTAINWEKDLSSPTAAALIAFAEAGADALYILSGQRMVDLPVNTAPYIEAQLADIRRDILEPKRRALPGESPDQAEKRIYEWHAQALSNIITHDTQLLPRETADEAAHLLDVIVNPAAVELYRAGKFTERRAKRREMKERLAGWLDPSAYGETVINLLATLAIDHDVPIELLVELAQEMHDQIAARTPDEWGGMKPRN